MNTTAMQLSPLDDSEIEQVNGGNPALLGAAAGFIFYKWLTTDWSDLPGGVGAWQD